MNTVSLSQPLTPVNTSVAATVNGGTYTYTVTGPPQGQALSVTISVPGAPQASSWSVTGAWTGSMQGSNSFGPLYLTAGGSLTVTGSSVSDPGPLQVTGVQGPLGSLQPSTPTSVGPSVEVGTVDATISGTVDANVTNATLDVTGTVVVSQVTEVTGTVTIDANGSNVTVDAVATGELATSIVSPATSATVITTKDINSILVKSLPTGGTVTVTGAAVGSVPCSPTPNGDGSTYTWVAALPAADTYTVGVANIIGGYTFDVYTSSGIEHVEVSLVSPMDQGGLPTSPIRVTDSYNLVSTNPLSLVLEEPNCLILGLETAGNYVTSMVDSLGRPVPYELVQLTGTSYGPVYLVTNPGGDEITVNLAVSDGATVAVLNGRPPTVKLPVQTVAVPNPAAGANWSYTLPYPAKVKTIQCSFFTDATAASRYPYIDWGGLVGGYDALPFGSPLAASSGVNLAWRAGSLTVPFFSPGANAWLATMPDWGVLPAGSIINSGVADMQSGDYWTAVSLVLEPA